jgi:hypothetical protein
MLLAALLLLGVAAASMPDVSGVWRQTGSCTANNTDVVYLSLSQCGANIVEAFYGGEVRCARGCRGSAVAARR